MGELLMFPSSRQRFSRRLVSRLGEEVEISYRGKTIAAILGVSAYLLTSVLLLEYAAERVEKNYRTEFIQNSSEK